MSQIKAIHRTTVGIVSLRPALVNTAILSEPL
jgi:hypothetical protein